MGAFCSQFLALWVWKVVQIHTWGCVFLAIYTNSQIWSPLATIFFALWVWKVVWMGAIWSDKRLKKKDKPHSFCGSPNSYISSLTLTSPFYAANLMFDTCFIHSHIFLKGDKFKTFSVHPNFGRADKKCVIKPHSCMSLMLFRTEQLLTDRTSRHHRRPSFINFSPSS